MKFQLVIDIEAQSAQRADDLRSEIVGAIEDNHESGSIAAEASVGPLTKQYVAQLEKLWDMVSEIVEDGDMLTVGDGEGALPDKTYNALVKQMVKLNGLRGL